MRNVVTAGQGRLQDGWPAAIAVAAGRWVSAVEGARRMAAGRRGNRSRRKWNDAQIVLDAGGERSDQADVPGAVNYVSAALTEAMAGQPVTRPTSRPYGCSVKYATGS